MRYGTNWLFACLFSYPAIGSMWHIPVCCLSFILPAVVAKGLSKLAANPFIAATEGVFAIARPCERTPKDQQHNRSDAPYLHRNTALTLTSSSIGDCCWGVANFL
jgi:hypothetical protein